MSLLDRSPGGAGPEAAADGCALDEVEPLAAEVGYGCLGRGGALGYDGGEVRVGGRRYHSALSAHPPARVRLAVPPGCTRFSAGVAINDDVAHCGSHATFTVVADGRVVAEAAGVPAGAPPRNLVADLGAAAVVELVVSTSAWAYCHAVWLDPRLDDPASAGPVPAAVVTDPLERAELTVPSGVAPVERCIATVASAGFEGWADDLLGSVRANAGCPDALLVVFALDDAPVVHEVAARHGALVVRCRPRRTLDPTAKAVLYAVGSVIPAERFVCLDADMLVLDDLGPLFAALDACPPQAVLVCREGNDNGLVDLRTALDVAYGGGADPPFLARSSAIAGSPLVVNDGLLVGRRSAFLALEHHVRALPGAVRWVDERADIRWRNQLALNVALVAMGSGVELDPTWNVQLHVQDVEVEGGRVRWRGRDVRVLHFAGVGKGKHPELRATTRLGSELAGLAATGRFEEALALAGPLAASGPLHPGVAGRLEWLEATMAPPSPGATDVAARPWSSVVPAELLAHIQQGVHHQRWRGRQLVKSPFDLAVYLQLLERKRPATIVEVGSKDGGSALLLADLGRGLGLGCTVHSFDLRPVTGVEDPDVRFRRGDGRRLHDAITPEELAAWPRPWLVIDDADHAEATSSAILAFFDPHLRPGDVVVVEDGNLSEVYPGAFPGHSSGPHQALRRFLARRGDDYEVAADLCDLFGHNATTASNGILRRRREGPPAAADGRGAPPDGSAGRAGGLAGRADGTGVAGPAGGTELPDRAAGAPDAGARAAEREAVAARLRAQPWRTVDVPADVLAVPTMLSVRERQLLHWLAQHHVRGFGRIVDAGCFLGGSTAALAAGLAARDDGPWEATVVAYDRFLVEAYSLDGYGAALPERRVGASFRSAFEAHVAPWRRHVEVREGDFGAMTWSGEPVEVLFLDLAKTWELNDVVLAQLLPHLVPGHSVLVQQDELWGYGPWIHLTMELLEGCVERLDAMANGSVAYLLTGPLPEGIVGASLREDLSDDRKRALMDRAVQRWEGEERGLVELARVMLLLELDGAGAAAEAMADVRARHAGQPRVEHCAAIVGAYLDG